MWKDILKDDTLISRQIEKVLNYHVSSKDDYNRQMVKLLQKDMDRVAYYTESGEIEVTYDEDDVAFYISTMNVTWKFDQNGRFERV